MSNPFGRELAGLLIAHAGAANLTVATGVHTTIDADDTIVTKLSKVLYVVACLESDLTLTCNAVTAVVGDQAGSPAEGSIQIKTWEPTGAGDTTPVAASAFSKLVNWIAWGY